MSDGYVVRGRLWPPPPGARAGVLYLHGIQSHGGWFEYSASVLNECGAAVILPDRRGSGLNTVDRGDVACADRWLDDLDELAAGFVARFSLECLAVLGVSWGGKLALSWLLRQPPRVTSAMLVAPGLHAAVDVSAWAKIRIAAALLFSPAKRFRVPLDDPELFTDNPLGQDFIRADPLRLTEVTARFLYASRVLDRRLHRTSPCAVRKFTTLVLAERERIIDARRTCRLVQRIVVPSPLVHQIPDSSHTLEFDRQTSRYEEVLRNWANQLSGNSIPA